MRPTRRALWLVALWIVIGLMPALNNWLPKAVAQPDWQPWLISSWEIATATLLILLLLDALSLRRIPELTVTRQHNDNLALGVWSPVTIRIRHEFTRAVALDLYDHIPPGADADHPHQQGVLLPGEGIEFHYRIRLPMRGNHSFGRVDLLLTSLMGFWQRRLFAGESTPEELAQLSEDVIVKWREQNPDAVENFTNWLK